MEDSERPDVAGEVPSSSGDPIRPWAWSRSPWLWLVVLGLVLSLATVVAVIRSPEETATAPKPVPSPSPTSIPPDIDSDGLKNEVEIAGWRTQADATYRTDPRKADTDGDGLSDGVEAGALVSASTNLYAGYANPLKRDTDGDRLGDADEADASTNPLDRDSDDDQLSDVYEVRALGTSPVVADTDGDGFNDGYEVRRRETKGLDPQWVDTKVSKKSYATDFAIGAVAGDAWRKDSFAWLMGNLASGGSSSIPGIGWIVGPVADVRDAVASAIRGDWVGSGSSAVGAVPYVGDAVAIPAKAAKFISRNPALATPVAAAIATLPKVSQDIKYKSVRAVHPGSTALIKAGTNKAGILRLASGKTNLDDLAAAIRGPGHVRGSRTPFFATWGAAEVFLEKELRRKSKNVTKQVSANTTGCREVCNRLARRFDVVADGVAHESKVGYKTLTEDMKRQIQSDAFAIKQGHIQGAHWHFFASGTTNKLGADPRLLDYLDTHGIPYSIHLPRA